MAFGLPARDEPNWDTKLDASINAVKATADAAVPKWKASTAYTAGDTVQAPDGSLIKSTADRTSSATFDAPLDAPVLDAPTTATTGGTIAAGTTYFYRATALNALGETLGSTEVSRAIAAALATPTGVSIATATTGGSLAPGTFSYRVSATNALGETLASTAVTLTIPGPLDAPVLNAPTTATTGGTLAAATYFYKITAINAIGETVGSNEVSQATTGTTSTVGLSWAAITGATGYRIYRATTTGGQSTSPALVAEVGAVTSYTDTGTAVSAGAVPATNTTSTTTNANTVTWDATTGATGYKVYGRTESGELLIATVGEVTTYTDTGSVTPAGALPTANTTATDTNTVGLSWGAVTGATGYKIYRATTTGGQSTSPALLVSLGTVTTYTDTGTAVSAGAVPATNTTAEQAFWTAVAATPGTLEQVALSASFAQVFNILKYGAVAGAPMDNRAAIQAAIDAAHEAGGGIVYVPEGTFGVEGWTGAGSNTPGFYALRLKNGVHLKGDGPKSILKALDAPGSGGQGAFVGNDQTVNGNADIWISDLTIDLQQTSTSSSAAGIMFGNPHTNIAEVPVAGAKIRGVTVRNAPFLGIQLRGGCKNFEITSCRVHDIYYIGIQVQNSSYGTIANNTVTDCSDNCIDLSGENGSGNPSACHHVTVSNNLARNGSSGIFLETTASCTLSGNTISDCQFGIYINRINSTVQGNTVSGNSVSGCTTAALKMANNSNDTAITGNTFMLLGSTKGIVVETCYQGAITGNAFSGPASTTTATGCEFNNDSAYFTVSANTFAYLTADITVNSGSFSVRRGLNAANQITTVLADG